MKVKEIAEFLKVSVDELLKLLKNVSVGKAYTEESDLDKDLEKKLAKRYGVVYPFKKKEKPVEKKVGKEAVQNRVQATAGSDGQLHLHPPRDLPAGDHLQRQRRH